MRLARVLPAFVAVAPVVLAAQAGNWADRATVTHPSGNLAFTVRWDPEAGLPLRIAATNSGQAVTVDLNRSAPRLRCEPADALASVLADAAQFNVQALPTQRLDAVDAVIKFRAESWSIYLGDRPVAVLPVPFALPAVVSHDARCLPAETRRATRFQKTDDFVFHDDFLVPEGDENELAAWDMLSGSWSLHSVADDYKPVPRAGRAAQKAKARGDRRPTASMSPNFYSLVGCGTNAVLAAGYDFYDAYSLEAAVQVGEGEGGLVFDYGPRGYHAFTVRPDAHGDRVRLSLWQTASTSAVSRTELAAVSADIVEGQWIQLQVRTFQNRIQCFVDGTKVIDLAAELPVGGRFGLFADAEERQLFDDVMVRSNHDLDFMGVNDIRRYALVEQGRFFPRRRLFSLFPPHEAPFLEPPESTLPQWLVVGSTVHGPHVFSAHFQPQSATGEFGLLAGYAGAGQPCHRFIVAQTASNEVFRLETVATNGTVQVLRTLERPLAAAPREVQLTCDATSDGALRCYRNGDLVLVEQGLPFLGGASGLFVGPETRVRITEPEYRFQRDDLYTDQFEKNTAFLVDRFMRHWSSPEGQWDDPTNNATWYKGDVFGRVAVHMPLIDHTAVHLGVVDGGTTGAWVVTVANGVLGLTPGAALAASNPPVLSVPTNRVTGLVGAPTNGVPGYVVHAEGYWVWVTSGDAVLMQQALPAPLAGRRLRIEGFTTEQLASSRVERYNVKDFLFKESLHEWTINGGRWEIINRFQCDPRWSHMDGESTNGLAALWSKYVFKGDFCVEMYAGTRHGWYERCGDYNLTVFNTDTTPSQGYTVTCTGWDIDQSQLYTTLYRDGVMLTRSDDYCAPRARAGNKRKQRSALVEAGRDVHGAWYYIKFRRVGSRLEYYFDNDLVFTCDDPRPLQAGSLGVWTYMTSMVVARVKIAAESVEPRPLTFAPAAPAEAPAEAVVAAGRAAEEWEAADPVSRGRLDWHIAASNVPYFTMTSLLGSGTLLARNEQAPVPYRDVLGWRFDVKRTERACFNFYYSVGRRNGEGAYVPERYYVHHLTGDDIRRGPYLMAGQTDVPATAPRTRADWHATGAWTTATAWLPTVGFRGALGDTGVLVRVEGFGALQPGYAMQGITGNGPGEGYAVRGFAAIPAPASVARPPVVCRWSTVAPDTLEVTMDTPTLNRALAFAEVTVAGQPVAAVFTPPARLTVPVPRIDAAATGLVVVLSGDASITNRWAMRWADAAMRTPPWLMHADGVTPFLENFERDGIALEAPGRTRLEAGDRTGNRHLTVFNTGAGQRLSLDVGPTVSLARSPVFRFRYRGDAMARVSLVLPGVGTARLSEPASAAHSVRGGDDLVLDGQWHTWMGMVSDAAGEQPLSVAALTSSRYRFSSVDSVDQTGRYTELDLDDLATGPAVSRAEQLACTPYYFDFEGVTQVWWAVCQGAPGYESLGEAQRAALEWHPAANRAVLQPGVGGLQDGMAHLLLKAANTRGLVSSVSDIPFLLHRTPPKVVAAFEPATDPMGNGSQLAVSAETAGGPLLDVEALRFRWNGRDVAVTNTLCSRYVPGPDRQKFLLNWPLVFRDDLNKAGADEAFTLSVGGLRDGAGNAAPDLTLPRRIDYAGDHTPPTLLATRYPSNILWTTAWEVPSETRTFFTAHGNTGLTLVRTPGEAPWLSVRPPATTGGVVVAFSPRWRVKAYPNLAFRIRRPALDAGPKARIDLVLDLDTNRAVTVALTPGDPGTNRMVLSRPITWASNTWASVTMDVSKVLADAGIAGHGTAIRSLGVMMSGLNTNVPVHLQSVFVFAPWKSDDRVAMDGYDESGIAGVTWETAQQTDGTDVAPATPEGNGEGWATLRMRDKAGNASTPLYLPMGGRPVPSP